MFQPAHIQHSSCICMTSIIMYILIQEVCGLIKPKLDSLKVGSSPTQQKGKTLHFIVCCKRGKKKENKAKQKIGRNEKNKPGEKNIDHMNAGNVSCYHKPDVIKIWS